MQATDIKIGHTYEVTAGRNKTKVKVVKFNTKTGSWECETVSGKSIAIKDAKRFLAEVGKKTSTLQNAVDKTETKTAKDQSKQVRVPRADGKVSGLEAALIVLRESGEAMNIKQIMEKINERNLASLAGKTPSATVSAAIQREISHKPDSRFEKAGKGLFRAK